MKSQRAGVVVFVALVIIVALSTVFDVRAGTQGPNATSSYYLQITPVFASPSSGEWLQAFVETGSTDKRVLLTLNEAACHESKTEYRIRHMSAAHRKLDGRDGVLITIMFLHPVPRDMDIWVTVMQHGAISYGVPVLWKGS